MLIDMNLIIRYNFSSALLLIPIAPTWCSSHDNSFCIQIIVDFPPSAENLFVSLLVRIGFLEEVISSGKVDRCPRGTVPNEVNAERTSHDKDG